MIHCRLYIQFLPLIKNNLKDLRSCFCILLILFSTPFIDKNIYTWMKHHIRNYFLGRHSLDTLLSSLGLECCYMFDQRSRSSILHHTYDVTKTNIVNNCWTKCWRFRIFNMKGQYNFVYRFCHRSILKYYCATFDWVSITKRYRSQTCGILEWWILSIPSAWDELLITSEF